MTGYKDYIIGNGILGLDKIGFDQYLASDQFQQLVKDSMGSLIDTAALQEQFTAAMQQVMGSVMSNFSEQIAAELQTQLGAAMEQAMGQISTNLDRALLLSGQPDGKRAEDRRRCVPECHPIQHDRGRSGGADEVENDVHQRHL